MVQSIANLGESWIEREFCHVDFGDARLNSRFFRVTHLLASKSSASIYETCKGNWGEAKSSYRFFDNERVNVDEIISSHQAETMERMSDHKLLFSIQDTSYLDFDSHGKTEGLGSISKAYKKHKMGLLLHPALVVTEQGLPLGLSFFKCWSREVREETKKQKMKRIYRTPIQDKESFKWIEALQQTSCLIPEGSTVITIGDREADIFEFLQAADSLKRPFVVRNRQDRKFINSEGKKTKLSTELSSLPSKRTMTIDIPKNLNREPRKAKVEVRYTEGSIPIRINAVYGPKNKDRHISERVKVFVINVKEINPPKGVEAVDWTLLSNLEVKTVESALEKVRWYGLRWKIEEYFRILKSGCAIENCRLASAEKLIKMIALKCVIAFKIMYLSKAALSNPDESCSKVLSQEEWQTLYIREKRTRKIPKTPPSIKEAIIWLGKLGGFLNRKGDKLPGTMVLWRGYEILKESIAMCFLLKPQTCG